MLIIAVFVKLCGKLIKYVMYILGLDYGEKNIGVAVGDPDTGSTNIIGVIRRNKIAGEFDEIMLIARKWECHEIVIGVALNVEGEETDSSKSARKFGKQLQEKFAENQTQVEIHYQPEQHSTQFSNQGLNPKRKQTLGDAYAAEHILRNYLEK